MLKGLTLTEFKEKFPQVSTYGLEDPLNVFLENGEILIEREWRKVYFGKWKKLPTGI